MNAAINDMNTTVAQAAAIVIETRQRCQQATEEAKDEEQKTVLFENMPDLVWSWLQKKSGSSGSYGGKSYCGAPALKIE